jgi:hypothetical protein
MDQAVIISRTALLQSVSDAVRHGYRYYTTGSVSHTRASSWARKAARYYAVDLDRNRRARAKQRGEGCARLLFHEHAPGELTWVLCCTAGDHPAHKLERLRDAHDDRIVLFGCELVQQTRPGSAKPAWTWRMTADSYEAMRAEIISVARGRDSQRMRQLVHVLYGTPGFAGLRKQVGKLVALLRSERSRRLGRGAEPLSLPTRLHYVERTRVDTVPLNVWLSRLERILRAHASDDAGSKPHEPGPHPVRQLRG